MSTILLHTYIAEVLVVYRVYACTYIAEVLVHMHNTYIRNMYLIPRLRASEVPIIDIPNIILLQVFVAYK